MIQRKEFTTDFYDSKVTMMVAFYVLGLFE